jgi:porin
MCPCLSVHHPILRSTLFSRLPGTPNNAWGVTGTFEPTKSLYTSYGLFDGNAGRFAQTGLNAWPDFNGYKFQIGEAGYAWRLHHEGKPGRIAAGAWHQSGKLLRPDYTYQNGDTGFYALGSQRLWYEHAGISPAGLTAFFQFGCTSSFATEVRRYAGAGLTAVSLIPGRPGDSFGVGLAWSSLNPLPNAGAFFSPGVSSAFTSFRPREIMWQAYYQAVLIPWFLTLQAGYSSIPEPGARPDIPWANALTVRFIVLF